MNEATAILALLDLPGIGRKTAARILNIFPSPPDNANDLFNRMSKGWDAGIRMPKPNLFEIEKSLERATRLADDCSKAGVDILTASEHKIQSRIWEIPDCPIILFAKGDLVALSIASSVAIIGTRHPTSYGSVLGERLAERFAKAGFVVVSGLAEGCDTHAHIGCIKGNGRTIAVLAHGLDKIYPRKNMDLANQIVSSGGCLLSEYPIGTTAQRSYFVERDRLQSGLSQAVIVVETDIVGGSMHTVGFCQDQKRILACLTHPERMLNLPQTKGNQKLIADGKAIPISTADDIESLMSRLKGLSGIAIKGQDVHPTSVTTEMEKTAIPLTLNLPPNVDSELKSKDSVKTEPVLASVELSKTVSLSSTSEPATSNIKASLKKKVSSDKPIPKVPKQKKDKPVDATQIKCNSDKEKRTKQQDFLDILGVSPTVLSKRKAVKKRVKKKIPSE